MAKQPPLNAGIIAAFLRALPDCSRYLVAYSGGLDSHVLLHLLASVRAASGGRVRAVHVNHNLQLESQDWARHCQETCRALDVELEALAVDASRPGKESPENWARSKRYDALEGILAEGEILLTAHHRDDQLETFLLRLLRGAGVLGLASMRAVRRFGKGLHARPLLHYTRVQLLDYAERHALRWIEDPSNADTRLDRNYIRHEVLPVVRNRWPSVALPVSRSVGAFAEAQELLDDLARQDLLYCGADEPDVLHLSRAGRLSVPRQKNMLRYWSRVLDLPPPDSRHLSRIVTDVIESGRGSRAQVNWKGAQLQRYGDYIRLGAPLGPFDNSAIRVWDFAEPCRLEFGELTAVASRGDGLKKELCDNARVEVRYRRGGEKIRLPGRTCRHKLKKLFQEAGTPPWLRARVPLVYVNGRLAMVAGFWTDADFVAAADEPSWRIAWSGQKLRGRDS